MPKYYVSVPEIHYQGYYVEADNPEQATEIAAIDGFMDEGGFEYSHTDQNSKPLVREASEEEWPKD